MISYKKLLHFKLCSLPSAFPTECCANSSRSPIKLKAELYALQFEYDSAGILYQQLWELDTTHVENTYNYADFLSERKQYDKALSFYNKLLNMDIKKWRRGNAYSFMGNIYKETGKFPEALVAYQKDNELYEQLYKVDKGNSFYKKNLAVSYEKLGEIYQAQGNFGKALEYFSLYNNLTQLENQKPQSIDY
ncbi:MAG: tetratricopeptide repeat protein [Okeania sp. SIO3C4]|nr:tetratricopeptide repeat protein [Okeania sp. SIO3C4]